MIPTKIRFGIGDSEEFCKSCPIFPGFLGS